MKQSRSSSTKLSLSILGVLVSAGIAQAHPDTPPEGYGGPEGSGTSIASADFNGDGYPDQAVGNPTRDVKRKGSSTIEGMGSVDVRYGSQKGLGDLWKNTQVWNGGSPGLTDLVSAQRWLRFGHALTTGDFNGDDYYDLVIGMPNDSVGGKALAGSVLVLYGSPLGLTSKGAQVLTQNTPGIAGGAEYKDHFGIVLAAGDFNGDLCDDLVVGVPLEAIGSTKWAGMIHVIWGSSKGLTSQGDLGLHQDSKGVPGRTEKGDFFGDSLATGDFDGDGYCDLAVGVSGEDLGIISSCGMVNLFRGGAGGLAPSPKTLTQIYPAWSTDYAAEFYDRFGSGLASGDINGDGTDDLVVSSPFEDVGSVSFGGAVNVILFKPYTKFQVLSNKQFTQNTGGVPGSAEKGDLFGLSLAVGDLDKDGYDDVAVGTVGEDIGSVLDAGSVHIFYGGPWGSYASGSKALHQDSYGVPGKCEANDYFGYALCIADYNGDGAADLAVGINGEDTPNNPWNISARVSGVTYVFEGSTSGIIPQAKVYYAN